MELGNQLNTFIVEVGIRSTHYRDIQANNSLLWMWRGMSRDMYNLMWHVVGAMTTVTQLRRIVARYRHGRDTTRDRQSASNDSSSHDRSPRTAPNE